jgi:large subunit ribosomal protein L30
MKKIRITLKKSIIGRPKNQRLTIEALGIKKVNGSVEKEFTPQIAGMVKVVQHLVVVEEV